MDGETWAERATAQLARMRSYGWGFDRSWLSLMDGDPPDWRRDFGIRGDRLTGTLEGGLAERRTEAWLREVFRAAYDVNPSTARLEHLVLPAQVDRVAVGRGGPGRSRLPMAA
jgi:hypothetical protein